MMSWPFSSRMNIIRLKRDVRRKRRDAKERPFMEGKPATGRSRRQGRVISYAFGGL